MVKVVLVLSALAASSTAGAAELVREFRGDGDETTSVFMVESPWLLDWRLDGPGWRSGGVEPRFIALDITLINADTGRHVGRVKRAKFIGNGLRMFNESGRYYLRVSTTLARWRIKIEQLSPEEAELYTPKEKS